MSAEVLQGEYLSDNIAIDQMTAATTAGTTTITSSALDCAGFDGVMIIAVLGTAATNNTLTLQTGAISTTADTSSIVAATASIGLLVLDTKLDKRYIKTKVVRGTSTTIDQVIAIRYKARAKAVAQTAAQNVIAQFTL